jgi:hypothetical protein
LLLLLFAVVVLVLVLLLLLFIDLILWVDDRPFWQVRSRTEQTPAAIISRFVVVGKKNFMIKMTMMVAVVTGGGGLLFTGD